MKSKDIRWLLLALPAVVIPLGCGDDDTDDGTPGGAAGTTQAGSGQGGSNTGGSAGRAGASGADGGTAGRGGSGASGASGSGGSAAMTCEQRIADLGTKLRAAKVCDFAAPVPCSLVTGQCDCEVSVASAVSAETQTYLDAITAFENAGCTFDCLGGCGSAPRNVCEAAGQGDTPTCR